MKHITAIQPLNQKDTSTFFFSTSHNTVSISRSRCNVRHSY